MTPRTRIVFGVLALAGVLGLVQLAQLGWDAKSADGIDGLLSQPSRNDVEPTRSINDANATARRAVCRTVDSVQLSTPPSPGTALTSTCGAE